VGKGLTMFLVYEIWGEFSFSLPNFKTNNFSPSKVLRV